MKRDLFKKILIFLSWVFWTLSIKMPNSIGIFYARFSPQNHMKNKIPSWRMRIWFFWSEQWDSNPQQPPWQGGTLANWAMLARTLVREAFYGFFLEIKFFRIYWVGLDSRLRRNDRNRRIFCIIPSFLYNRFGLALSPFVIHSFVIRNYIFLPVV